MLILNESEIRDLADTDSARAAIADAFACLHRGEATLPSVISLPFSAPEGVVHIKAGHLHDDSVWTLKVSGDFQPGGGAPTLHSGLMLVMSASDGAIAGVLVDNGYLTELRTGAAGAIAADLLARKEASTVAIVGAGSQARFQLAALREVRPIEAVRVASRSELRAQAFVDEIRTGSRLSAERFDSVAEAVRGADIVVTTTPATAPVLHADWLDDGTHVTAVGSDEPSKQELEPEVLARASVIAVDDREQAARLGELHHALERGLATRDEVVTLGELIEGAAEGRARPEDLTVADLTGVGVQDAAIAALVLRNATSSQLAQLASRSQS
jgi:ornithine cyclodeaminase